MGRYLTAMLLLSPLALAAGSAAPSTAAELAPSASASAIAPAAAAEAAPVPLSELALTCASFKGEESLSTIRRLLERDDTDINAPDAHGETPLLLLCHALELDYRYRHEPGFRQALKEAMELMLRHGADPLMENEAGCNAIFYIEGKPDLAERLKDKGLMPRELALRIPSGGAALTRYIRKRAAQAQMTKHEGSLAYLSRRYCAPAYDRVFERLQRYLRAESSALLPPSALRDCLAFLRLADRERIEQWVNENPLWEHSEHFLEEIPERFLTALYELGWQVPPKQLKLALGKLDLMLPHSKEEMIDCFAGVPMSQLLRMLHGADAAAAAPLIEQYTTARDSTLAAEALCLQLDSRGLPRPEPAALKTRLLPLGAGGALSSAQQALVELARVDAAIDLGDWEGVDAALLRRVQEGLRRQGCEHHAELLDLIVENDAVTSDADALAELRSAWSDPAVPSPRQRMARTLLQHPEYCSPQPPADEAAATASTPAAPAAPAP